MDSDGTQFKNSPHLHSLPIESDSDSPKQVMAEDISEDELLDEYDHSFESEEFGDERLDDEFEDDRTLGKKRPSSKLRITCFSCNRYDYHYLAMRNKWYYSYLTGMTFGLIKLIGPYKCKCCGFRRLLRWDWMHPKRWMMTAKVKKAGSRRSRR